MSELTTITLTEDALISGRLITAGTEVKSTNETVNKGYKEARKRVIRQNLNLAAGDAETILGTTSDLTHLLLVEYVKLVYAISAANELKDVKAIASDALNNLGELGKSIINRSIVFPYENKGEGKVLSEIIKRAKATASILNGETVKPADGVVLSPTEPVKSELDKKARYKSPFHQ